MSALRDSASWLKGSWQGTKDFVAWQKIVGLQIFLTASLKFDDSSWVILEGEKRRLH